ncbi:MAG: FxLYD domain-containing protein [Limisphaerales bacterium]
MKYVAKGFLFSVGMLPVLVFTTWLFHNWPLWSPGSDGAEEFLFDKSQLRVGEIKLSRDESGLRGLGEISNNSDKKCGFVQLDIDLIQDGKIIAHSLAVVSELAANSTRGFSVHFPEVPQDIDPANLKVQAAIAQAFTVDLDLGALE